VTEIAIGFIATDPTTGKRSEAQEPVTVVELEQMIDSLIEERIRSAMWPEWPHRCREAGYFGGIPAQEMSSCAQLPVLER
jgi:hypothetical protein